MAKTNKTIKDLKKLELVPADQTGETAVASIDKEIFLTDAAIPKGAKKLTLPPLLKPETIPMGAIFSGKIVAVVPTISKREDMKGQKLLHMQTESGREFLLPLTGTIKSALGGYEGAEKKVGETLIMKRTPDGTTTKYGGTKKVYQFEIYLV